MNYVKKSRLLARENSKWPMRLAPVPPEEWEDIQLSGSPRFAVWRSREFLVQAFGESGGVIRLSVNRTRILTDGQWDDQISWDDLQALKYQAGYGNCMAVEIYPEDRHLVNVANMRHLWVLPEPLGFGWRMGLEVKGADDDKKTI
ncbi:MAG: hypothetical protein ABIL58_23520 [Pseudomonadota bacterium]